MGLCSSSLILHIPLEYLFSFFNLHMSHIPVRLSTSVSPHPQHHQAPPGAAQ